jgi:hypothetical protein
LFFYCLIENIDQGLYQFTQFFHDLLCDIVVVVVVNNNNNNNNNSSSTTSSSSSRSSKWSGGKSIK